MDDESVVAFATDGLEALLKKCGELYGEESLTLMMTTIVQQALAAGGSLLGDRWAQETVSAAYRLCAELKEP